MTVLEMSRVDRVRRSYPLAALFPNLAGPFTAASIALVPPRSNPNGSTVWATVGVTAGAATPLFAGPDADSSGAFVVTGSADVWIEVTVGSETDAVKVERITLLGSGTVIAPGPVPPVLSVQGRTGAVVLSPSDVGAATPTDLSTGLAGKVNTSTYTAGLAGKQDVATLGATVAADATVRAAYAPKTDPTFTGTVGLPGGTSGNPRLPVNGAVTIDGATARNAVGGGDKVGYAFTAQVKGGFTGDTGSNPSFAWGANDFVMTGNTAGDVASLTDLLARETEVHLYTPGASLSNMKGLQVDANIESSATGSTVGSMFGIYVSPLSNASTGTTVTNAFGVYIEAPTVAATNKYGLYVNGTSKFVGSATFIGSITANGITAADPSGTFKSLANTPNAQGAAAGVYIGSAQGAAVELSDGTHNVRLDNDGNGALRVLTAGVQVNMTLDSSGNLSFHGGLTFNPPATATAPAAGPAGALPATPAGYMTINVNGTNRQVAYY